MSIQTKSIVYEHQGTSLEGLLAWDDATSAARPGVLVSHGWAGRSEFEDSKAVELAKLGYAGFALNLYGQGVQGSSREENAALMKPFLEDRSMLQSRLGQSLQVMADCDCVDASRTAIMGFCFGGLCALDLARSSTSIRGAISIHGLFNAPVYDNPVKARILALHGWDDPMVPPEQVLHFAEEMTKAGADWQLHAYGNTMHAFTNPDANDPDFGTMYSAVADRRSWIAVENFLSEIMA